MSTQLEVRCTCPHHPLLALAGRTEDGGGYVHVRAWRGKQLKAEVLVTSGVASIKCPECERWHTVKIVVGAYRPQVTTEPPSKELISVLEATRSGR